MKYFNLSALYLVGFLICHLQESFSGLVVNTAVKYDNETLIYLSQYGYLDIKNGTKPSEDDVRKAIFLFQNCFGLLQTGEIDEETKELMNFPRCGMEDDVCLESKKRMKRYILKGSHWEETNLTYRITKYPKGFKQSLIDRNFASAFKIWSDVSELTFTETTTLTKVHIEIRFMKGEHGDKTPFIDEPGKAVAHATYPSDGGDIHFDETVDWTFDSDIGVNLLQVSSHEIGHALGISHSNVKTALMGPIYLGYEKNLKLKEDDIAAIQKLYGKKPKKRSQ